MARNRTFDMDLDKVMTNIHKKVEGASRFALKWTAQQIAESPELSKENIGFYSVTGNLWKSIGVAAVFTNPKTGSHTVNAYAPSTGAENAYGPTLKPGQDLYRRRLKQFYSGLPAYLIHKDYVNYVPEEGTNEPGGRYGDKERAGYVRDLRNKRTRAKFVNGFITMFVSLPYTPYMKTKKNQNWFMDKSRWFEEFAYMTLKQNFNIK